MFDYIAVHSVSDAISVLSRRGAGARVLAGGTDLLVKLRDGREQAELLVDVKPIPEIHSMTYDKVAGLRLGAAVPCMRIRKDPVVAAAYPSLIDSVSLIGSSQVQGRASVGGNLCSAAPSGDTIPTMIVLNAVCTVVGPQGIRTIPVGAFCTGPGETVLQRGEILLYIDFPPPEPNTGARYLRFTPREEMDIAVVGVAAWVALDNDLERIRDARIALGTAGPKSVLVKEAGISLVGNLPGDTVFDAAAKICRSAANPRTSIRGTAEQRSHIIEVLGRRALWDAVRRARGDQLYAR